MSAQDKPPIVRDLKLGRTIGQSKLGDGKGINSVSPGGRFARPFHLFTYLVTAGVAVSFVALGVSEKDHRGNDHVFSSLHRYLHRKKDEFFFISNAESQVDHSTKEETANK